MHPRIHEVEMRHDLLLGTWEHEGLELHAGTEAGSSLHDPPARPVWQRQEHVSRQVYLEPADIHDRVMELDDSSILRLLEVAHDGVESPHVETLKPFRIHGSFLLYPCFLDGLASFGQQISLLNLLEESASFYQKPFATNEILAFGGKPLGWRGSLPLFEARAVAVELVPLEVLLVVLHPLLELLELESGESFLHFRFGEWFVSLSKACAWRNEEECK